MSTRNYLFIFIGAITVAYSMATLYRVGNSYSLPIYGMTTSQNPRGVEIDYLKPPAAQGDDWYRGGFRPRKGDIILKIGGISVPTYEHFVQTLALRLRYSEGADTHIEAENPEHADPSELPEPVGLVSVGNDKIRWMRVEFLRKEDQSRQSAYVRLNSPPPSEILVSLAWFLLKMIIFVIGALVVWKRPRDVSANVFYVHCAITVVAFMGGFHWRSIAGSPALFWPFLVCAMLVAPLAVHFYMWFPHPHAIASRWPRATLAAIYGLPSVWICLMVWQLARLKWYYDLMVSGTAPENITVDSIVETLAWAEILGYSYVPVAAIVFVSGQGILFHRFFTSPTQAERNQVKWILAAFALSSLPLGLVMILACTRWKEFALGQYTSPMMFITSTLFTLAYAVSITRYRLMQAGRILNRGFLYFLVSFTAMAVFCLLLAGGTFLGRSDGFDWVNVLLVGLTSMVLQVLMGFWGDRIQKSSELRFYREKYQLDKAMRRLGRAVEQLVEPSQLIEQMLQSATDAVSALRGAVYLREEEENYFTLVVENGSAQMPKTLDVNSPLVEGLEETSMLSQWSQSPSQTSQSGRELNELGSRMAIGLEVNSNLIGLVLLGPKEEDQPYTQEDRNFLTALAGTAALALQSAQGRRTVEELQQELQSKVEEVAVQRQEIMFLQGELSGREASDETKGADSSANSKKSKLTEPMRHDIRGSSPVVREMLGSVAKIAQHSSSVLIRGDSGTGKELLARAIHFNSPRAEGPFVVVHCAALSPSLLESELFGHVKGAFTGADRDRIGRFEMADCGTLFLDEIGDISAETQTKLLRVMQEKSFERVGGMKTISVDVRLLTATHRHLEQLITEGKFREDLFWRLNVISLTSPPLRDRGDDLFELSFHFLRMFAQRTGKSVGRIEQEALDAIGAYAWPGNVRQLQNAIERSVVLADGESITLADLPPEIVAEAPHTFGTKASGYSSNGTYGNGVKRRGVITAAMSDLTRKRAGLVELEKERIAEALNECGGNKSKAARMLGMHRSTFFSKLKKYGLV